MFTTMSMLMATPGTGPDHSVPFADAARFWIKLGFINFGGPSGQIALMRNSALYTIGAPRDQLVLQATQPLSFTNSRLVIAGWLSLNPLYFTSVGLGLALLLALSTWWLVRNLGRRQP